MKKKLLYTIIGISVILLSAIVYIIPYNEGYLPQQTVEEIENAVNEIIYNFENGDEETKFRYAKGLLTMGYNWGNEGIYNINGPIIKPNEYDKVKSAFDKYNSYKEKALKHIEEMAYKGFAEYQYTLGFLYLGGDKDMNIRPTVPQDLTKAAFWLEQAAHQEHPAACYHYGDLYYMIEYYPKDIEQAMYWWKKAAAKGERRAKNRLLWIKENNKYPVPTNMNND